MMCLDRCYGQDSPSLSENIIIHPDNRTVKFIIFIKLGNDMMMTE
ncbi:Uncharacterised protein [Serratia fonticola]|nr:Uncharacterised protein [Serratia fonticola]CAI0908741.1 Uncharacterised protein [Serratia fonticola]CAI1654445.1 Uncharacterised protein [Serratia fonticola]CAI1730532.1 Uncharacterised protein [Serratia fonticola]CAI1809236.1 Uncharacterised protein [Serratia fonticola]